MSNVEHCSCMWICCPHGSLTLGVVETKLTYVKRNLHGLKCLFNLKTRKRMKRRNITICRYNALNGLCCIVGQQSSIGVAVQSMLRSSFQPDVIMLTIKQGFWKGFYPLRYAWVVLSILVTCRNYTWIQLFWWKKHNQTSFELENR